MSTARERLADLLRDVGVEVGHVGGEDYRLVVADRLLAHPDDLLAVLVEAGVLKQPVRMGFRHVYARTRDGA